MCSLINKQLLLTAYAYLFIMEQQKAQQGSEALELQVENTKDEGKANLNGTTQGKANLNGTTQGKANPNDETPPPLADMSRYWSENAKGFDGKPQLFPEDIHGEPQSFKVSSKSLEALGESLTFGMFKPTEKHLEEFGETAAEVRWVEDTDGDKFKFEYLKKGTKDDWKRCATAQMHGDHVYLDSVKHRTEDQDCALRGNFIVSFAIRRFLLDGSKTRNKMRLQDTATRGSGDNMPYYSSQVLLDKQGPGYYSKFGFARDSALEGFQAVEEVKKAYVELVAQFFIGELQGIREPDFFIGKSPDLKAFERVLRKGPPTEKVMKALGVAVAPAKSPGSTGSSGSSGSSGSDDGAGSDEGDSEEADGINIFGHGGEDLWLTRTDVTGFVTEKGANRHLEFIRKVNLAGLEGHDVEGTLRLKLANAMLGIVGAD